MPTLKEEIQHKQKELQILQDLVNQYPDISKNVDRWGYTRYSSKSINSFTNEVEIHHSCGCCDDALLYAKPFLRINEQIIYSHPVSFTIGYKNNGNGDIPYPNWENPLIESRIPQIIIDKIGLYFDENKPDEHYDEKEIQWLQENP